MIEISTAVGEKMNLEVSLRVFVNMICTIKSAEYRKRFVILPLILEIQPLINDSSIFVNVVRIRSNPMCAKSFRATLWLQNSPCYNFSEIT